MAFSSKLQFLFLVCGTAILTAPAAAEPYRSFTDILAGRNMPKDPLAFVNADCGARRMLVAEIEEVEEVEEAVTKDTKASKKKVAKPGAQKKATAADKKTQKKTGTLKGGATKGGAAKGKKLDDTVSCPLPPPSGKTTKKTPKAGQTTPATGGKTGKETKKATTKTASASGTASGGQKAKATKAAKKSTKKI